MQLIRERDREGRTAEMRRDEGREKEGRYLKASAHMWRPD